MGLPQFRFTLKHKLQTESLEFANNSFDISLSGWNQVSSGGDVAFTWASVSSARANGSVPDTTAIGQQRPDNPTEGWPPGDYRISVTATNSSTGGSTPAQSLLNVYASNSNSNLGTAVTYNGTGTYDVGAGKVVRVISFTLTDYCQYLYFKWTKVGPTSGYNVDIRIDVIEIIYANVIISHKQISEPDGWKDAKLIFERHPDFCSLVEYFESAFIFYGSNGVEDGGIEYIKTVEAGYGVDANILMLAEVTFDELVYETVFEGLLDLSAIKETKNNKVEIPLIRDTMWTKFISRLETPVDLRSMVDLDGNPVDPVQPVDINLTAQIVREKYEGHQEQFETIAYTIAPNQYGSLDFADERLSEIDSKFSLPRIDNPTLPGALFTMDFAGAYTFDIRIVTSQGGVLSSATNPALQVRLRVNSTDIATLTQVNQGTVAVDGRTVHTYSGLLTLEKNDNVYLYFINTDGAVTQSFDWQASILNDSYLRISGDTIYPSSTAQGFLLHDAFAGVIQRIIGRNCFYSDVLGSTTTNMRSYGADGCYWGAMILRGLQIRTYTLAEKPFSISFKELWDGADPIYNLGLGYDTVSGESVIRIENKAFFYQDAAPVLNIANVEELTRGYDKDKIFKTIEIGFNKWQSENVSGIDDPQSKRTYATRFEKIGKDVKLLSGFIAASLAIEETRRRALKKTEDYKFDNDTFIIALNTTTVSPDRYVPELTEAFDSVTGIVRPETRYNIIFSAARMFLRYANVFGGCLQQYLQSVYRFVSGEGNYDMVSDYSCSAGTQCIGVICDAISEKQDIALGSPSNYNSTIGFIHLADSVDVDTIDFSWDDALLIRNNRRLPIGISQTDTNFNPCFINKIEYQLCFSKATLSGWPHRERLSVGIPVSENPAPSGGWTGGDKPTDDELHGCNSIFYDAKYDSDLQSWASEGGTDIPASTLETLSGWDNAGIVPGRGWTLSSTPDNSLNGDGDMTDYIRGSIVSRIGLTYQFSYQIEIFGSGTTTGSFNFALLDNSGNILAVQNVPFTSNGVKSGNITLTPSGSPGTYYAIQIINTTPVNSKSFEIQASALMGGTGASSVPLPSWAWSSAFFGSAKVQALYDGYGVKNFVLDPATLPTDGARLKISFSVNNPNLKLRLIILDSVGGTLYNNIFAEDIDSATERTEIIDITNTTTLSDANKFEIVVESDDFTSSDIIYITDFLILYCTELPMEPFDPDYQAILDYGTAQGYTLPSADQQIKQNQLVLDLKSAGAWDDIDVLYVFATDGDRSFAKINWVAPGTFQATEHGTVTFHSNSDFQGDASTGYLDTAWVPSVNGVNYTQNDASVVIGVQNDLAGSSGKFITGSAGPGGAPSSLILQPKNGSNRAVMKMNGAVQDDRSSPSSQGLFHLLRPSSSIVRMFKNGSQLGTDMANGSTGLPTKAVSILAYNNNGTIQLFSDYKVSVYALGASMSGKESDLYTAWNDYFTSL